MATKENIRKPNSVDNPYYLSAARIRKVASKLIEQMTMSMACRKIPTPYNYELKTDEATVELRRAIQKYIARMQDERLPYEAPDSMIVRDDKATGKNIRKSNPRTATATATSDDPLGECQEVVKRVHGLGRLEKDTWAELDKFIAEQGDAVAKEYGLEGDLDDGMDIMLWIAYLCKDAERASQPQVDAVVRHLLEPSTPA
jgi:hypothetical protein